MKKKIAELGVRYTRKAVIAKAFSSYRATFIDCDGTGRVADLSRGTFYATESYNAALDGGVLRGGTGAYAYLTASGASAGIPKVSDPPAALAELGGAPIVVTESGRLYVYDETLGEYLNTLTRFSKTPALLKIFRADGEERLVVCGAEGVFSYGADGEVKKVYDVVASSVACVCRDRVFFAIGDELRYCAPTLETDWSDSADEAGYLKIPDESDGEIVALAGLSENLYIFRRRGIVKATVSGAARDFCAEKVAYDGGEILGAARTLAGKVYFLTADGLKALDEHGVEAACENLSVKPATTGEVCMTAFGNKLLLRYTETGGKERAVILDASSGSGYFSVLGGRAFALGGKGVFYYESGGLYTTSLLAGDGENPISGTVSFGNTSFGLEGKFSIGRLTVYGLGTIRLTLTNDEGVSRVFLGESEGGRYEIKPFMRGERFTLRLSVFAGGFLTGLRVDTTSYGG